MEYQITDISQVQKSIKVDYSSAEVEKARDKEIAEIGKDYVTDGYRKGKVPAKVIESKFAEEIKNKVPTNLVNQALDKIFTEKDINPISKVQLEGPAPTLEAGQDFSFSATFDVLPSIEIVDFKEMEIDVLAPYLNPGELEEETLNLRRGFAEYVEIKENRTAKEGDIVRIDVHSTYNGQVLPSLSGENLLIKANPADKFTVYELVEKMTAGQELEGKLPAPEDYHEPEIAGKEIEVKVKLHALLEEKLPELDEEFVKKTKFETVDALRKAIFENVLSRRIKEIKDQTSNKLLKSLIEAQDFEVPPSMVLAHSRDFLLDARDQLRAAKLGEEFIKNKLDELKEQAETVGQELAKAQCFLLCVADKFKLEVTEQEADRFLEKEAQMAGQDPVRFKQQIWQSGAISDVRERLLADKAHEYIYKEVKKNVVDQAGNKVEAPQFDDTKK